MKRPIILQGEPFDWAAGATAMSNAVNEGTEGTQVNWRAAFSADPGVVKCFDCGVFLWREGEKIECPDCHAIIELALT